VRAREDVAVSAPLQFAVNRRADKPAMAGNIDTVIGMHEGRILCRGWVEYFCHDYVSRTL
jgi:hypothetical protein